MYKNNQIVAIITARQGSKRIPGKNIKIIAGKPLIAYAILACKGSKYLDRIIISTDSRDISKIAQKYGAEIPFIRPADLSGDGTPTEPVLQHAIDFLEKKEKYPVDVAVLVQPTSPFVSSSDIDDSIIRMFETKTNSCFTVCPVSERPEWMYEIRNNKVLPYTSTKRYGTRLFRINGAVYVTKKEIIMNKSKMIDNHSSFLIMPRERSIDIDEPIDFIIAETLMNIFIQNNDNTKFNKNRR